jgi:hypothetical protein
MCSGLHAHNGITKILPKPLLSASRARTAPLQPISTLITLSCVSSRRYDRSTFSRNQNALLLTSKNNEGRHSRFQREQEVFKHTHIFLGFLGISSLGIWAVNREAVPGVDRYHCILVPHQLEYAIGEAAVEGLVRRWRSSFWPCHAMLWPHVCTL